MSAVLNDYETIMVIDNRKGEQEIQAIVEKFKNLISSNAEIGTVDVWGRRKLAYPIDYQNDGYYVLVNFKAAPEFPKELERVYRITDGILRTLVVRIEKVASKRIRIKNKKAKREAQKAAKQARHESEE